MVTGSRRSSTPPGCVPKSASLESCDTPVSTSSAVNKLLFTPEEAAEVLSIGRSKLYELLADGSLESVAIGACRRIPSTALQDFVECLRQTRKGCVAQGIRAS